MAHSDLNDFDDSFDDFPVTLKQNIKNIIQQEGYIKFKVKKKTVPLAGNFLSTLHEVDITGETADGEKETPLFLKKSVAFADTTISLSELYSRELYIYDEVSKVFVALQDEANIPENERFTFIKTYNSDNEAIIMENLTKKGFRTYSKTEILPLTFIELSIIQLAKFHAVFYVMKKKTPEYFNNKVKVMKHPFKLNSDWVHFLHKLCVVAEQVVEGDDKAKIRDYAPRFVEIFDKYVADFEHSNGCICHGDYKFLNIMVKEENGEVSAVQPMDYQTVYYGSPLDDFMFLIFTSTEREFRKKHLSHLKELYFGHFTTFLSYFDVDVDSVYPRQKFDEDYKEKLELGLGLGLYMSVFLFIVNADSFDLSKQPISELRIVPNAKFSDRVRGLVEDYVHWGYL